MEYRVRMEVRIKHPNNDDELGADIVFRHVSAFSPGEAIATAARFLPIECAVDDATATKLKEPK